MNPSRGMLALASAGGRVADQQTLKKKKNRTKPQKQTRETLKPF